MPNDLFDCGAFVWPTKKELLTCLYNSKKLNDSIRNLAKKNHVGKELMEELKSELFLILCEKQEQDLIEIYTNGYFDYFVIKILTNLIKGVRNKFHRTVRLEIQNRSNSEGFDPEDKEDANCYDAHEVAKLFENSLNWFQKEVVSLYIEHGSLLKAAEITGTSRQYVDMIMKSAKIEIKKRINDRLESDN